MKIDEALKRRFGSIALALRSLQPGFPGSVRLGLARLGSARLLSRSAGRERRWRRDEESSKASPAHVIPIS